MGSTGIHLSRGRSMADAVLADLNPALTVLAHKTKRTTGEWQYVLYAAVEHAALERTFGLVVLMHRNPSPHVYWNFHYKYVEEEMGPYESECPVEILNLLTETDNQYAQEWRARCRAFAAQPKPKPLKAGDVVEFTPSLLFTDKVEASRLTYVGRNTFRRDDYRLVKINSWRARGGQVVTA